MAEFCKECSIKIFGKDFCDFKHNKINLLFYNICENCGWIITNWQGEKVEFNGYINYLKQFILMDLN